MPETMTIPGDTGARPVTSMPSSEGQSAPSAPSAPAAAPAKKSGFFDDFDKIPSSPTKAEPKPSVEAQETPQDEPEAPEATETPEVAKDAPTEKPAPKAKGSIAHEQFEKLGNDLKSVRAEKAALEAKIKDYESKGKNTDTLETERETLKKELEETKAQLAQYNPAVTEEFKKQFDAPFEAEKKAALASVEYFPTVNPETGEFDGPPAKWEEFTALYATDPKEAAKKIQQKWGAYAPIIMNHIINLRRIQTGRDEALQNSAKIAESKFKEAEERRRSEEKMVSDSLAQYNRETIEASPEIYGLKPSGEDDEGNAALQEGIKEVANRGQTPQEYAKWLSTVQLRAAAFPRMTLRLKKATEKVAELEGVIAKMKGLSPNKGGKPTAETQKPKAKGLLDALNELK